MKRVINNRKPLILVTNDDGYQAKGIVSLIEAMRELGDVVVFAPELHQSGMSSAISTSQPLRSRIYRQEEGLTAYMCTGTPVDCVKLALNKFMDRKPDLLVSGINHGSNAGISVIYSERLGLPFKGGSLIYPLSEYRCANMHTMPTLPTLVKSPYGLPKLYSIRGFQKESA